MLSQMMTKVIGMENWILQFKSLHDEPVGTQEIEPTAFIVHIIKPIVWIILLLTHSGLVMPYGGIDLGQHWFR